MVTLLLLAEVAPFFPDGETEAQGGFFCLLFFFWDLAQVTHSESAFGRYSSHAREQGHTGLGPLPTGQAGQGRGPKSGLEGDTRLL